MKAFYTLLVLLASLSTNLLADDSITIDEGWVRSVPPSAVNTAAYMTITNHQSETITLLSAHTDAAKMTQIHLSKVSNGLMKMEQQKQGIEIPADSTLKLKPGSYHIMIMGLKQAIAEDDELTIELKFSGDRTLTLNVPVKSAPSSTMSHSMHDKQEMNKEHKMDMQKQQ